MNIELTVNEEKSVAFEFQVPDVKENIEFMTVKNNSLIFKPTKYDAGEYKFNITNNRTIYPVNLKVTAKPINLENLEKRILETLGSKKDNYGIYLYDFTRDQSFKYQETKEFPVASLIKIPIVVLTLREVDKGKIKLSDTYTLQGNLIHPSPDKLSNTAPGAQITFEKYINDAITISSNTAQYHLRDFVQKQFDGKWLSYIIRDELGANPYFEDPLIATPKEVYKVFRGIYESTLLSKESSEHLLNLMKNTAPDLRLGIPAGVPEGTVVASKVGFLFGGKEGDVYNDGAIVYGESSDYILIILNNSAPPYPYGKDMLREISKVVYDELN
jgi:beta-lactamase class A